MNNDKINKVFTNKFGITPLAERIDDILKQAISLSRYQTINELKEYTGNLLASVIQLCNENDVNPEHAIEQTLEAIQSNSELYKSLGRKRRIAILGGAFDPVTLGHFRTAQFVLNESGWADEVWMMPAFEHMYGKQMTAPDHRMNMVQRISVQDKRIKASGFEIDRKLSGETYKTSKLLAEEYPNNDFAFIIGQDNANTIQKWVNASYLIKNAMFIVVPREGVDPDLSITWYNEKPHISLLGIKSNIGNISSSMYKHRIIDGKDVTDIMDAFVLEYISRHNLYSF